MEDQISAILIDFWEMLVELAPKLLAALVVILLFFAAGHYLGKLLSKILKARLGENIVASYSGGVLKWIFYIIGVLSALNTMGLGSIANNLLAGAGISAIIFGFAFKDIAENFLAGVFLLASRPFQIGNIIEVSDFKGVVRGMTLRTTHLRNLEGKDFFIPNSMIIKNVVINYTRDGLLRLDFLVSLDIPTDLKKVRRLLLEYLSRQNDILKKPEPDVLTKSIDEFTVTIQVLFWVDVLKQKKVPPSFLGVTIRSRVIQEVKDLLLNEGINMPSQVVEHKMYDENQPLIFRSSP